MNSYTEKAIKAVQKALIAKYGSKKGTAIYETIKPIIQTELKGEF